jgi:outer membrane protein insertion porin family
MRGARNNTFNAEHAEIAENYETDSFLIVSSLQHSSLLKLGALLVFLLSYLIALPRVALSAQSGSSTQVQDPTKILASVKVKGTKRFKDEDVIAASGLQIGRVVSDEDFKKAARALGDTGAFTDIAYSFSYSSAGTKLELQLSDAPKFLPAHFEDFVWFSDEELNKAVRNHVPLFHGEIAAFGHMADEVSDALQTLLVQNGIAGRVEYLRTPGPGGGIASFSYSVADVFIRIRDIKFTGVAPAELPLLEAAAQKLPERGYSRTRLNTLVERDLSPILRARGFLKASFGPPQPKVVKIATASSDSDPNGEPLNTTNIDVEFAVVQGRQYKVSAIEWSGNSEFPSDKLQGLIHLQPGQPADTVRLGEDLAEVRTLYGSKGYVNAALNVDAQFDDAASTAAIHIGVKEEYVYHMGDLEFRGLDNGLTAKLREAWKIRQGEVYDATYLDQYLPAANKLLPASLDWEVVPHVTPNIRDKTVDVDLQYSVKAPKQ